MSGGDGMRCPYAEDHPVIEQRIVTLEREMGEIRRKQIDDGKEWRDFLVDFGELKAKVEGLSGRLAGYVVAATVLTGAIAVLAQFLLQR